MGNFIELAYRPVLDPLVQLRPSVTDGIVSSIPFTCGAFH